MLLYAQTMCNWFTWYTFLGRFDLNVITAYCCCKCGNARQSEMTTIDIVSAGLWPGTPVNFNVLFDQELFEHFHILQKRMPGVSERSFLLGLQDFSFNKGRVCLVSQIISIYFILSIPNFRFVTVFCIIFFGTMSVLLSW